MANVTRAAKIRLGIFVAVALTALIGGLAILAGMKLSEEREPYTIRFDQAEVTLSGLDVGSPVKYSGIKVGRVDGVRIDPKDVSVILVEISLDEGTPVAEDSKANLGSLGITGLKYIELTRGSSTAPLRKSGGEIPAGVSAIDDLTNQAGEIATKVNSVMDRALDFMSPAMKDRVAGVLDRTNTLLDTANVVLLESKGSVQRFADSLSEASVSLQKLSAEVAESAKRANALLDAATALLKSSKAMPENVNLVLAEGAGVLKESRVVLGPEGLQKTLAGLNSLLNQSRQELVETITYLRETAENASVLSQRLRDDPSLLIMGDDGEER